MSSDSDIMSQFTALDELIQVVYQGTARFVILSSVDDASWTVHVGLTGDEGRWWRGKWTEKDVKNTVGSKVSSFLLESFVEKIADTFIKGDITIGDWNAAKGAQIDLVLGTSVKTPIRVPLNELSPEEGAAYATKVFAEIALQAQSRRCRLHPSTLAYEAPKDTFAQAPAEGSSSTKAASRRTPSPEPTLKKTRDSLHKHKEKGKDRDVPKASSTVPHPSENRYKRKAEEAEEQIEALKAELEKTKRKQGAIMTTPSKLLPVPKAKAPAVSRPKGASLANPTKKARKYQALEFESDDE